MVDAIKVVQYGLGPIGIETARTVLEKAAEGKLELVGAIDIDPAKAGKDVSEILGLSERTGVLVSSNAEEVLQKTKPDIVLHTTSSFLEKIFPQLELCLRAGACVISSAEELFFPFSRHPELSRKLDELARKNRVVVLGTGVNPGFVMDTLALVATGVCKDVQRIRVERVVDASKRREPLQRKIGAGLTIEEFAEKKKTGTFGHIGLRESLLFLADGLGWKLDDVTEDLAPLIADQEIRTPYVHVLKGQVRGLHQVMTGIMQGREVLHFDLQMDVAAMKPHDAVVIDGNPPVDLFIRNGIFGDTATVASLINAIPLVLDSTPGLKTMKDLAVPRVFS